MPVLVQEQCELLSITEGGDGHEASTPASDNV